MKGQFSGQRESEEVGFVFRRHIITMWRGFFGLFFFAIVGFVPLMIVPENRNLIFVGVGGVALGLIVFFYHWIGWYFTIYILTNQRIRQNVQKGLFKRSVVDVGVDKIQSAFVEVSGVAGSMLGFGTVILHTQAGDLVISKVSRADEVYAKLQDEIGKVEYQGNNNEE
ncbi:MAG: PH domain-containing protein [Candidatus Nomurabacteria bacterium]|jgi:uncharacterized membrane protein YdbT with pleckstrin-like domain|nr:PH domain-containing protein [Candidatus Nomurabacteria bacterium]